MKQRIPDWETFLNERKIEDIPHKKNKWFEINPDDYSDVEDEFYELIQNAYRDIGGHIKVKKPADVFHSGWNYWVAVDIDDDADIEVVRGSKTTPYGYKSAVVGHDGSKAARHVFIDSEAKDLKTKGKYAEVSHKLADILLNKYKVHVVNNPDAIQAVVGKPIKFYGKHPEDQSKSGDGWYEREIGGQKVIKTLVGRPLVKEAANFDDAKPTLLIIHGYESSVYPSRLLKLEDEFNLLTPAMDYENESNLFTKTLNKIKGKKIDMIVGSSMGGYFGYYIAKLLNIPALLFNPAVVEATTDAKRPEINKSGKSNPRMTIVSGNKDNIIIQKDLENWLKQNGKNYEFVKENMGHQIPDDLYIEYVKKLA